MGEYFFPEGDSEQAQLRTEFLNIAADYTPELASDFIKQVHSSYKKADFLRTVLDDSNYLELLKSKLAVLDASTQATLKHYLGNNAPKIRRGLLKQLQIWLEQKPGTEPLPLAIVTALLECEPLKSKNTRVQAVAKSLSAWGAHYHVATPWVFESALLSLAFVEANDIDNPKNTIRFIGSVKVPFDVAAFPLQTSFAGWAVTSQSASDYKREALLQFRSRLDDYVERMRASCESKGAKKQKARRQAVAGDARDRELHTVWLVRYQVHGWSLNKIAREEDRANEDGVSKQSVHRAIHTLAARIGLPLREPSA